MEITLPAGKSSLCGSLVICCATRESEKYSTCKTNESSNREPADGGELGLTAVGKQEIGHKQRERE
jgi:hypothetical protein